MPYGIQQPALSEQILQLETDLGTKLFERQPFRLKPVGRELYDAISPFFGHLDSVETRLRHSRRDWLRIGAAEVILRDYLPKVVAQLQRSSTELEVVLRSASRTQLIQWVNEGEIDLAIIAMCGSRPPGLAWRPIVELPVVLVVPAASPIRSAEWFWRQRRISERLICPPPTEGVGESFQRGLSQGGIEWPARIVTSTTELVAAYVASGHGIGVGLATPGLACDTRVRALPLSGFAPVSIGALWRPPLRAVEKKLLEIVDAEFAGRQLTPA
jgi:DNA-binding transcriptional LysR family regulator